MQGCITFVCIAITVILVLSFLGNVLSLFGG